MHEPTRRSSTSTCRRSVCVCAYVCECEILMHERARLSIFLFKHSVLLPAVPSDTGRFSAAFYIPFPLH
ncbi:hypothetical protein NFI96_032542 [Prochilodus magdalenae]|nr:hypothetical protein NFI96_032542 [Prochilodus magdalenae]